MRKLTPQNNQKNTSLDDEFAKLVPSVEADFRTKARASTKSKPGGVGTPAKETALNPEAASPMAPPPEVEPSVEHQPENRSEGKVQMVALADAVLRAPFSTLLSIDADTYDSIKADMQENGFDPTQPCHLWEHDGQLVAVDGCTRIKAAQEVGLTHVPAFIHQFASEEEALAFAVKCQVNRRSIKDGELVGLVAAFDDKVKPGSGQPRAQGGSFAPKASDDALGKSAAGTAKKFGVSTTKIERARRVIKKADPATKKELADNAITIQTALKRIAKAEKARAGGDASNEPKPPVRGKTEPPEWSPFELIPGSDVAFAHWEPVICKRSALPDDPADQTGGGPEFTLDEAKLEIDFMAKALKGLPNRRVLVSTRCDLFAEEVPAKVVRRTLLTAAAAKEFQFLFTTSNPGRLQEFSWEENTFAGVSIFEQRDVAPAEAALEKLENVGKWLVVEQLTMELTFEHLDQIDWLVLRAGAGVPGTALDSHAMKSLLRQAWAADCPVLFEQGITYRPTDPPKERGEGTKTPKGEVKKGEGKDRE